MSSENTRILHIELDDTQWKSESNQRFLSFVLYEKERDQWYNNEGRNFHIPLSLETFRTCSYDTQYSLEKEIAEYLEYAQHIKLRLRDVHNFIELWPEKVTEHLCKLLESHSLEGEF